MTHTIITYNNSTLNHRANTLWKDVTFIDYFNNGRGMDVGLYSLSNFYVELYYNGLEGLQKNIKKIKIMVEGSYPIESIRNRVFIRLKEEEEG